MERLTYFKDGYWRVNFSGVQYQADFVDRLAAYEDMAELCGGVDRLRELAEADKAGRVVVLPCRVGKKICYLNGKYIIEVEVVGYKVDETGAWLFIGETYNPETNRAYHCDLETERIGKTVFFAREDAEKAMEGGKGD